MPPPLRCAVCRQPSTALICPRCQGRSAAVRQVDHIDMACRCGWPLVARRETGRLVSLHLRPRPGAELGPALASCPNCHLAFPTLSAEELVRHLHCL